MPLSLPPRAGFAIVALLLVAVLVVGNPCHGGRQPTPLAGQAPSPKLELQPPLALQVLAPAAASQPQAGTPPQPVGTPLPAAWACPLRELEHEVRSVGRDERGELFWVLADGRVVRRTPDRAAAPSYEVMQPAAGAAFSASVR